MARRNIIKDNFLTARWNTLFSAVLGLLVTVFVISVLTALKVPLISGEKASFIVLAVLGAVLCVGGNSHSATMFGWMNPVYWTNPINIMGMILGIVALLLAVFVLAGINVPFLRGQRTAFIVLAAIIFLKVGLKILFNTRVKAKA